MKSIRIGKDNMASTKKQSARFLAQLGELVVQWNDLESILRSIIFAIVQDPFAAIVLSSGLNIATLISMLRTLTNEYDVREQRVFKQMKAQRKVKPRSSEPLSPHLQYFLVYVDTLREYRNFYVHCIGGPGADYEYKAHTITAKGRIALQRQSISIASIGRLTREIEKCRRHGEAIRAAIVENQMYVGFKTDRRSRWPSKPSLPERLKKERMVLLDILPIAEPFDD